MIEFYCQFCGNRLKVKDELKGQRGRCPHCGNVIEAPKTQPYSPISKPRDTKRDTASPLSQSVRVKRKATQTRKQRSSPNNLFKQALTFIGKIFFGVLGSLLALILITVVTWHFYDAYHQGSYTSASPATRKVPSRGTVARLQYELGKALGSSNRDVKRIRKIQVAPNDYTISVFFAINDNLTNNMVKSGAKMDICDILKAVQKSGCRFQEVAVFGSFSMVDKFGNASENTVVKANYTKETVDKINWSNFLSDNIYEVAESAWLAPAFR